MAKAAGHGVKSLIGLHEQRLIELCLITPRVGNSSQHISTENARLTDLAFHLFENLKSYQTEMPGTGEEG